MKSYRLHDIGLVLDFILLDDNARPHMARVVQQYLQAETIDRMDWPARHQTSTSSQFSMLGTCCRLQFQLVMYTQSACKSSELH